VQSGGIWDTTSFNYVAFTYLASQYSVGQTLDDRRIINDSADLLVEMCLQNFIAAQEVSSLQTAQTWRILAELCSLQSAETTGKLSPSLPFGNPQAFKQLAGELLEWYCNEGDVQMCVALILLLTNQALLPDTVDQQSATEWFFTYIGRHSIILMSKTSLLRRRIIASFQIMDRCCCCD
jgi:hypothetical protein